METSYVYIFVLIYWVRSRRKFFRNVPKPKIKKIIFSRKDRMRIILAFWFFTGWDFWFEKFPCGLLNSQAQSHFRFWVSLVKWKNSFLQKALLKKILLRLGFFNDDKNFYSKMFFNQFGHGGQKSPLHFQNSSKNYLASILSD